MLKLKLEKATNGCIITLKWLNKGSPQVTRSAVFNSINAGTSCFERLSAIMDEDRMTIQEFISICSEYRK